MQAAFVQKHSELLSSLDQREAARAQARRAFATLPGTVRQECLQSLIETGWSP